MDRFDPLLVMMVSPLLAAAFGLFLFSVVTVLRRHPWRESFNWYLRVIVWPIMGCFFAVGLYVMGATIYYRSGNGPLVMIFYGPAAIACGIVLGTLIWLLKPMKPNSTIERDARNNGARPSS